MSETNTCDTKPGPDMPDYPNRTITLGRLVLTTGSQGAGAPVIDGCTTHAIDGWTAVGWCIRLPRTRGRALVVAWKGYSSASQFQLIDRMVHTPLVGRLFRGRFS